MEDKPSFNVTTVERRIKTAVETAEMFLIKDEESLNQAHYFLKGIADLLVEIDAHHDPIIDMAKQTHIVAVQQKRILTAPLQKSIDIVKPKMSSYLVKERERVAEEEAAKRKAEEDRKQLELEAIRKAAEAEAEGKRKAADKIIEEAAEVEEKMEPVPTVKKAPEIKGLHLRKNWKYRITDQALLCKERPDLMIPDHPTIGRLVRAMKEKTDIPGVEAYSEDSTIQR